MFDLHLLLSESSIAFEVVAAIDINTTANDIYRHNLPTTPLWNRSIEVKTHAVRGDHSILKWRGEVLVSWLLRALNVQCLLS